MQSQNKQKIIILNLLVCLIYGYFGYFQKRNDFYSLISLVLILFIIYFFQLKYKYHNSYSIWLPRIILIFSLPNLSDDFYRYILDGQIIEHFENPYTQLPSKNHPLYSNLNSPNYYSIYPPIAQVFFGFCCYLSQNKIFIFVILFKTIICIVDYWTFKNLKKLLLNNSHFYFLNPLIIIEFNGNMHLETLAICFISFFLLFKKQEKILKAALFISLAILTKLLPALFLIPFILKIKYRKNLILLLFVLAFCIIAYAPFLINSNQNPLFSLGLYFNHFEFNASIYNIFKTSVQLFTGYNPIHILGPILAILFFIFIFIFPLKYSKDYYSQILLIFISFFLLSTTIHPWYLSTLVFLNLFAKTKSIFVWSFSIFLSYFIYSKLPFKENYYIIVFEYLLVVITFWKFDLKLISNQLFQNKNVSDPN